MRFGCNILLGLLFLASCATTRNNGVWVNEARTLIPDDSMSVSVDVTLEVPERAFTKRSRLIAVPQLLSGDTVMQEFGPIVMDAPVFRKKMDRYVRLFGYRDSLSDVAVAVDNRDAHSVPFSRRLDIPGYFSDGRMIMVLKSEGCGSCGVLDTLDVAYIGNLQHLLSPSFRLPLPEYDFEIRPKVRVGRGTALLNFVINLYDINLDFADNRREMTRMLGDLQKVVDDSLATLDSVSVYGMASADGPYAFNTELARNRALSARKWLEKQLCLSFDSPSVTFVSGSRPEGWLPVLEAMEKDGHPDAARVREILDRYDSENDDVAEKHIRALSCWPDIRVKYLKKDRKVDYEYTYRVRNYYTDEEMLRMYVCRPDSFNESEFLRVSEILSDGNERISVLKRALEYCPESETIASILAVELLESGDRGAARTAVSSLEGTLPELVNVKAVIRCLDGDYAGAETLLAPHTGDDDMRYNLALVMAMDRKYVQAFHLMRGVYDVNAAVVALCAGKTEEAGVIMEACGDSSALAEYVRAVVAARTGDEASLRGHLAAAASDAYLKERMAGDYEFVKYHKTAWFRQITDGGKGNE